MRGLQRKGDMGPPHTRPGASAASREVAIEVSAIRSSLGRGGGDGDLWLWSLLVNALVDVFVIGLFVQLIHFFVRLTRTGVSH